MDAYGTGSRKLPTWLLVTGLVIAGATAAILVQVLTSGGGDGSSASIDFEALQGRAQDRTAQSNLRNALVAAKAYYVDNETYSGFDKAAGDAIEPSLSWVGDKRATEGTVSINHVARTEVVLSTLSSSGTAFCIADDLDRIYFGTTDAVQVSSAPDCGRPKEW
jgi:hypothetical protein